MAMLAEPRRKQKVINLRAKNNAWSNDSTKFGQRMLEKMGWSSGKGLGAHENGITEHVVARYKNDERGLGFEDKNDQWTKHEDDFNSLLVNLSNASNNYENLHSGVSLEDKSKKSKARIHYHKFTRGKDISRYSEKDLANIFGKKSLKNEQAVEEPSKEDLKTTEQVFTEKGSMADYFKNKLASFKSKNMKGTVGDESNYIFCGFSQDTGETEVSCNGFGYSTEEKLNCNENNILDNPLCATEKSKKKNKKSKSKDHVDTSVNDNVCLNNTQEYQENINGNGCQIKGKKKNKKKSNIEINSDISDKRDKNENCTLENIVIDDITGPKKSKKRKKKENSRIDNSTVCHDNEEAAVLLDTKKKFKKEHQDENDFVINAFLEERTEVPKKNKKKKKKD